MNYYNEKDKKMAAWLRVNIAKGLIANGVVDERSIEDVRPDELAGFTQCHLFAGLGAWSLALRRAGWPDDRAIWTGSCPCQPFSPAGKGLGFADERHLYPAWNHLISECNPAEILGEQVADGRAGAWIDLVQDDLEALDYAFGAVPFPAASVGAPINSLRCYWVAKANNRQRGAEKSTWNDRNRAPAQRDQGHRDAWKRLHGPHWRATAAGFCPDAHGAAARMVRHSGYGNAINVEQAQAFIESVMEIA